MRISRYANAAAAATGLLFVLVLFLGISILGSASFDVEPTDASETIAQAFIEGADSLVTGSYLLLIAAFLIVVFGAYLRSTIGDATTQAWPTITALGGAILAAAVLLFVAMVGLAEGQLADYGPDSVVAKTLLVLGSSGLWILTPGLAALVGGAALGSMSTQSLSRLFSVAGLVVALILLTPFWGPGLLAALLWIGTVSVVQSIREIRAPRPRPE